MLVIKGIYERGEIRLLESVPQQIEDPQEVTIMFAEAKAVPTTQADAKRQQAKDAAFALIGLLNTLSVEQMQAFDAALQRAPFFGAREMLGEASLARYGHALLYFEAT